MERSGLNLKSPITDNARQGAFYHVWRTDYKQRRVCAPSAHKRKGATRTQLTPHTRLLYLSIFQPHTLENLFITHWMHPRPCDNLRVQHSRVCIEYGLRTCDVLPHQQLSPCVVLAEALEGVDRTAKHLKHIRSHEVGHNDQVTFVRQHQYVLEWPWHGLVTPRNAGQNTHTRRLRNNCYRCCRC